MNGCVTEGSFVSPPADGLPWFPTPLTAVWSCAYASRARHRGKLRAMGTVAMLNWAVGAAAIGQLHLLDRLVVTCHYRVGIDRSVTALYFFFDPSADNSL